jgi:general secretion pathway protein F
MILAGIRQKVNEGGGLAEADVGPPQAVPELYTNMVRSGETPGTWTPSSSRLADFMDQQQRLRSKVSGAMTYPILMMVIGTPGRWGVLMVAVVPKINAIFEDSRAGPCPGTPSSSSSWPG